MGIMDNEKLFDSEYNYMEGNLLRSVLVNVNKRFHGYYAENLSEAVTVFQEIICGFVQDEFFDGRTLEIGIGDSMSVHQAGIMDYLYHEQSQGRLSIINPFERLPDGRYSEFKGYPNDWLPEDTYNAINRRVWDKARRALLTDVFVTGLNAITYDGEIVSTDGVGNRLAGIIYGPYKVVLIAGRNKIVKDIPAALDRIKNVAAPLNHYRHFSKHKIAGEKAKQNYGIYKFAELPCVKLGRCVDCGSPMCTRHVTMLLSRNTGWGGGLFRDRIHVILVNEDLGC